tara:strand:+ start:3431 stop:4432 length:1002 start_codon:yes stop_codon:yes gene_type:complete
MYGNKMKNLLQALRAFGIKAKRHEIEKVIRKFDRLNWSIEAIHIFAWIKHAKNWNSSNYLIKLQKWGEQTSKNGRANPYFSNTPGFKEAREYFERGKVKPEWVETTKLTLEKSWESQTMEEIKDEHGAQSEEYKLMQTSLFYLGANDHILNIEKLSTRYYRLLDWINWKDNTREQCDKCYANIKTAIENEWFEDEGLIRYVASRNYILWSFIEYYKGLRDQPESSEETESVEPFTEPAQKEESKEEEQEEKEYLFAVICRIQPHKLPFLGYVLKEVGDTLQVWFPAPIKGQQIHMIHRSASRPVENVEMMKTPGSISRSQIDRALVEASRNME